MSLAGPKLTPQTFQQGLFSMAATGGAATGNTQNYMTAYGPCSRSSVQRVRRARVRLLPVLVRPDQRGRLQHRRRQRHRPLRVPEQRAALRVRHVGEGRAEVLRQVGLHLRDDDVDDSDRRPGDTPCPGHPAHVPVHRVPELGRDCCRSSRVPPGRWGRCMPTPPSPPTDGSLATMHRDVAPTQRTSTPSKGTDHMSELPRIISTDDHVVEPPDLWTSRLPAKYAGQGAARRA